MKILKTRSVGGTKIDRQMALLRSISDEHGDRVITDEDARIPLLTHQQITKILAGRRGASGHGG